MIIIDDSKMTENPPKLVIVIKRYNKIIRKYIVSFIDNKANITKIK